jgi:hypothetical protein
MKLNDFKARLLTIGPQLFHYFATGQTGSYMVLGEDSDGDTIHADNRKSERATSGTLDYFTKIENDPVVKQIEDVLDSDDGISWYLNSVQYEQDTGYIHFEWVWEVDGSGQV